MAQGSMNIRCDVCSLVSSSSLREMVVAIGSKRLAMARFWSAVLVPLLLERRLKDHDKLLVCPSCTQILNDPHLVFLDQLVASLHSTEWGGDIEEPYKVILLNTLDTYTLHRQLLHQFVRVYLTLFDDICLIMKDGLRACSSWLLASNFAYENKTFKLEVGETFIHALQKVSVLRSHIASPLSLLPQILAALLMDDTEERLRAITEINIQDYSPIHAHGAGQARVGSSQQEPWLTTIGQQGYVTALRKSLVIAGCDMEKRIRHEDVAVVNLSSRRRDPANESLMSATRSFQKVLRFLYPAFQTAFKAVIELENAVLYYEASDNEDLSKDCRLMVGESITDALSDAVLKGDKLCIYDPVGFLKTIVKLSGLSKDWLLTGAPYNAASLWNENSQTARSFGAKAGKLATTRKVKKNTGGASSTSSTTQSQIYPQASKRCHSVAFADEPSKEDGQLGSTEDGDPGAHNLDGNPIDVIDLEASGGDTPSQSKISRLHAHMEQPHSNPRNRQFENRDPTLRERYLSLGLPDVSSTFPTYNFASSSSRFPLGDQSQSRHSTPTASTQTFDGNPRDVIDREASGGDTSSPSKISRPHAPVEQPHSNPRNLQFENLDPTLRERYLRLGLPPVSRAFPTPNFASSSSPFSLGDQSPSRHSTPTASTKHAWFSDLGYDANLLTRRTRPTSGTENPSPTPYFASPTQRCAFRHHHATTFTPYIPSHFQQGLPQHHVERQNIGCPVNAPRPGVSFQHDHRPAFQRQDLLGVHSHPSSQLALMRDEERSLHDREWGMLD